MIKRTFPFAHRVSEKDRDRNICNEDTINDIVNSEGTTVRIQIL